MSDLAPTLAIWSDSGIGNSTALMEFEKRRGESKTRERGSRLMGPDWTLLPPELVQLISEKISSMDHYVHLRSVCWPWRRACIPNPRHLIPQIPWFWFDLCQEVPSDHTTLSMHDFSKSKIHNFELPGVSRREVCGHSRGWIVLLKDNELSFINPITREMKSGCFPSLAVPPNVLEFARNKKNKGPGNLENHLGLTKVILTSSPSDKDCIVVAEFQTESELGFARTVDTCWTILKLREYGRGSRRMCDFKCRNDSVYVINDKGCLIVYNLRDLSQKVIRNTLTFARGYHQLRLVLGEGEVLDGVPLVVLHDGGSWNIFHVFKCVNEPSGCKWRRVRDIGNAVLLQGYRICEFVSLGSIRLDEWEKNHVFYDTKTYSRLEDNAFGSKIKMVSIENKSLPFTPDLFSSYKIRKPLLVHA